MKIATIGRSAGNDFIINDGKASRSHCQITMDDRGLFYIDDLKSLNGTYVNERKINGTVYLKSTDVVRIGDTRLPWQSYFPAFQNSDANGTFFDSDKNHDRNDDYGDDSDDTSYNYHKKAAPSVIVERGPVIPAHVSVRHSSEHAEVMRSGNDFKVPFMRNVGNAVGNTVGCILSVVLIVVAVLIFGLCIRGCV
jgi:hypothetical protein